MENNPRAKQFMPFAALKGYYDIIREKQKILEPKKELAEFEIQNISNKLSQLRKGMIAKIKYYNFDSYTTFEGMISNIDFTFKNITIIKTKIKFDDILEIQFVKE